MGKCQKSLGQRSARSPWERAAGVQLTLAAEPSVSAASVSAPTFVLAGGGEGGLHGLIPGPQREYALRNFRASGFGGGELSWER